MLARIAIITLALFITAGTLWAKDFGTAGGKGRIERQTASGKSEWVKFNPRYSYTFSENAGGKKYTWIVLTEKEPQVKAWAAAKDPHEAWRLWCGKEKTPVAAVQLDPDWKVNQYVLCPADGGEKIEMLSTMNGLASVAIKFQVRNDKQLKGTLRTGEGSCGDMKYCTETGNYAFDAVVSK